MVTKDNTCPNCNVNLEVHSALDLSVCYQGWINKGKVINTEIYHRRFPKTFQKERRDE